MSLGSLGFALGSSDSSTVAGISGVRPVCRWVHPGPLRSQEYALSASSGKSGVAGFTGMSHWGRRVHPGTLRSPRRSLGVVGLIRGRCVLWDTPWDRVVHQGSLGSLKCVLVVVRFIQCLWIFIGVRPGGRWVHPGTLGSPGSPLGVVGLILEMRPVGRRVHPGWLGAPWGSSGSSAVNEFIRVRPVVLRVHPGSLDSLGCAFVLVGFMQSRWVNWGEHWCLSG